MLNILWPIFIIISFVYAIIAGNIQNVNNSIFESTSSAVQLSITFLGTICLWNGIMKIAQKTTFVSELGFENAQKLYLQYFEEIEEDVKKMNVHGEQVLNIFNLIKNRNH